MGPSRLESGGGRRGRLLLGTGAMALVGLSGCGPSHHDTSPTTSAPSATSVPPATAPVSSTTLLPVANAPARLVPEVSYQADPTGADSRHAALVAYVGHLTRVRRAPESGGSEVAVSACSPSGAAYCASFLSTGASYGGPGQAINVADYTFDDGQPAFGNSYEVTYVPSGPDQFGLSFTYDEDGGSIGGSGYTVQLIYFTPSLLAAVQDIEPVDYFDDVSVNPSLLVGNELDFTDSPEYATSTDEDIGIPADARTVIASLRELMASPATFRAYTQAREAELLAEVKAQVSAGHVTEAVDCQNQSDGKPPICGQGPLTGIERAQEIARAEQSVASADALINRRYAAMYALLSSQLFWTACPACWAGS